MRRLKKELYASDRKSLVLLRDQINGVLANPLVKGKPPRRYVGATDGTVSAQRWHLDDAVSIIRHARLPKGPQASSTPPALHPQRSKPRALLVLEHGRLKIVQRKSGATCWTTIPAQVEALEPKAFSITYEHLAHISDSLLAASGDRPGRGSSGQPLTFRLSTEDRLWEFFDETSEGARTHPVRIPVRPVKPDPSPVWAQSIFEGVEFDAAQLASALKLLLASTRHVGRELDRLKASGAELPVTRRQDFAAVHVEDGAARIALRSCTAEVEAQGLKGLRFAIGRQDAKALVRALHLMTVMRRTKYADQHMLVTHRPRWSRLGDLHVITNGDVGFAFNAANSAQPQDPKTLDVVIRARQQIDLASDHRHVLSLKLVEDDLRSGIGLVRWDAGNALLSLGKRGKVAQPIVLNAINGDAYPPAQIYGPEGQISFFTSDLLNVLDALYGGAVDVEILGMGDKTALRLTRAFSDHSFNAWLAAIPSSDLADAYRR
ncbi:hypothetical protein [Phenylobacterium sp.]|uniref:hypothetical protein n=1 Tax=Phenylobacterium sp. TaxID=1871053 RepID=UPI002FDAED54